MANQRLTSKTALEEQAGTNDILMIVDSSDTSSSAQGTSKKMDFKYLIQTDKISVSNAEIDLNSNPKTLVGALSGYMITVYNVTILTTQDAADESSNASLMFTYDTSVTTNFWLEFRRFMNTVSTNASFCFSPSPSSTGTCKTSLLNKPFSLQSSADFNGGWSAEVYITYAYTKVL